MAKINRKRERETYSKMFFNSKEQQSKSNAKQQESVTDYVQKKFKKEDTHFKTVEDQEIEKELEKIDTEVEYLVDKKCKELSFEVKEELENFPEIEQVKILIEKAVESYKMSRKVGAKEEAEEMKTKLREMKFAKEHLIRVMNLDFSKPT